MLKQSVIGVNRYTDFTKSFPFTDADGQPEDMTGWTLAIVDKTDDASFEPAISWTDQAGGIAQFSVPWNEQIPSNVILSCRIHLRRGEEDIGTDLINLMFA